LRLVRLPFVLRRYAFARIVCFPPSFLFSVRHQVCRGSRSSIAVCIVVARIIWISRSRMDLAFIMPRRITVHRNAHTFTFCARALHWFSLRTRTATAFARTFLPRFSAKRLSDISFCSSSPGRTRIASVCVVSSLHCHRLRAPLGFDRLVFLSFFFRFLSLYVTVTRLQTAHAFCRFTHLLHRFTFSCCAFRITRTGVCSAGSACCALSLRTPSLFSTLGLRSRALNRLFVARWDAPLHRITPHPLARLLRSAVLAFSTNIAHLRASFFCALFLTSPLARTAHCLPPVRCALTPRGFARARAGSFRFSWFARFLSISLRARV